MTWPTYLRNAGLTVTKYRHPSIEILSFKIQTCKITTACELHIKIRIQGFIGILYVTVTIMQGITEAPKIPELITYFSCATRPIIQTKFVNHFLTFLHN